MVVSHSQILCRGLESKKFDYYSKTKVMSNMPCILELMIVIENSGLLL